MASVIWPWRRRLAAPVEGFARRDARQRHVLLTVESLEERTLLSASAATAALRLGRLAVGEAAAAADTTVREPQRDQAEVGAPAVTDAASENYSATTDCVNGIGPLPPVAGPAQRSSVEAQPSPLALLLPLRDAPEASEPTLFTASAGGTELPALAPAPALAALFALARPEEPTVAVPARGRAVLPDPRPALEEVIGQRDQAALGMFLELSTGWSAGQEPAGTSQARSSESLPLPAVPLVAGDSGTASLLAPLPADETPAAPAPATQDHAPTVAGNAAVDALPPVAAEQAAVPAPVEDANASRAGGLLYRLAPLLLVINLGLARFLQWRAGRASSKTAHD
jgi:hypothetical protein